MIISCYCYYYTGFSFGGLLASTLAACVWDTPYIGSDLLKENMACITFGQPHVTVEIIDRVARRRPKMVSTIHAIFIKDDQIPSLMGLLDECWSDDIQQSQSKRRIGVQLSAVINHGQVLVSYLKYHAHFMCMSYHKRYTDTLHAAMVERKIQFRRMYHSLEGF